MSYLSPRYKKLLVVIKQTAFEEYSQLRLYGKAPKALRWKRLEARYKDHKKCVNKVIDALSKHNVTFNCIGRVGLDRQHLSDVDLMVAVGGDGTCLTCAHFLDNGSIPLLGINSDPLTVEEMASTTTKQTDERRSHGALCAYTSNNIETAFEHVLYGGGNLCNRTRIQCTVKSTFSETRLCPALNDLLISHPSPASVSRFGMGFLVPNVEGNGVEPSMDENYESNQEEEHNLSEVLTSRKDDPTPQAYRTRFGGTSYEIKQNVNVWSSGLWVSTATGSTAAMVSAGGQPLRHDSSQLQYLVREHMVEQHKCAIEARERGMGILEDGGQLHIRWNSNAGAIFIDGAHLYHDIVLGDEILINAEAPPLKLFMRELGETDPENPGI